jgi:hypothetical protein
MSFEIHKDPHVSGSAEHQLELQIERLKHTVKSPHDLIEHVIKLYGAEFIKANARIAELMKANDELFKIKQKVVIANRELMQRVQSLDERDKQRAAIVTAAVAFCDAHSEDFQMMSTSDSMDIDTSFMLLCQLVEAHKIKAEDTPA